MTTTFSLCSLLQIALTHYLPISVNPVPLYRRSTGQSKQLLPCFLSRACIFNLPSEMGWFYKGYNVFVLCLEVETQCSCLVKLNNFKHCVVICDSGEAWLRASSVHDLSQPRKLSLYVSERQWHLKEEGQQSHCDDSSLLVTVVSNTNRMIMHR